MGILRDFDYKHDGFPFANFDTDTLDWDTYRRTYLSIWPTNDVVGAPLDVAFYAAAFEHAAKPGHCVGLSTLAITIWQLGGWFGFSSPASFYLGPPDTYPHPGPESDDLRQAVHILHGRQFDAGNVTDVLQTAKAGHINDGMAAYDRVVDGLASGDLQLISISDGLSDGHAHCLLPYRCETLASGERDIYVWDSVRPYALFPDYYDLGYNVIRINGPADWTYNQNPTPAISDAYVYEGAHHGWLFAFSSTAVRNKGSQPFSVGFAMSDLSYLVLSGSASVAQIEDDEGRLLFETDAAGRPTGWRTTTGLAVLPWPWAGGSGSGSELYLVHGDETAITVHVDGQDYSLQLASAGRLTEVAPRGAGRATDSIRIERRGASHALELRTSARSRRFDVRHVHQPEPGVWAGVRVQDALVTDDAVRVELAATADSARLSGAHARRKVDLVFERFSDGRLSSSTLTGARFDRDHPLIATAEQ
ncbi:hypothetical protein [Microbacterium rhizosphaerae]|uniref:Uncharacterized protein n=1 Tax=Microbacterium rhizosphaerae TaxID=1678237 RepID=A0ABZ0SHF0_9MICO|nr:hypothetical protein [Microbacterium rhizosphaerae]WPR88649.1 hypothetical protein SM116_12820 [Microbacterium rhizosphaerae]